MFGSVQAGLSRADIAMYRFIESENLFEKSQLFGRQLLDYFNKGF
jgi:hypothetical protein